MFDLLRDSTLGVTINYLSKGRYFPYPDQKPGYVVPERYRLGARTSSSASSIITQVEQPVVGNFGDKEDKLEASAPTQTVVEEKATEAKLGGIILVDWEGDDDQDNPRNWSSAKRGFVLMSVCLLTFSIYIGSAIYTASEPGLMEHFGSKRVIVTLGLSVYVWGYGMGPMILSPLQELPSIGRNPVYIITLFLFVVLQVPTALAHNMAGLLVLRFIAGFLASPALATGGASISDIYPIRKLPYAIGLWSLAAVTGPVLGPIAGGFAAQAKGWRWPIWELLWIAGFGLAFLTVLLPETLGDTILLKRAQRLRKLTGNENLRSASEIKQAELTAGAIAHEYLVRPFQLLTEPAVFFLNLYLGLAYAIFYLWFEAFPITFGEIHHFNLGLGGLPFIGIILGTIIAYFIYAAWNYYYLESRLFDSGKTFVPEKTLLIAAIMAPFIPASLFIFGWTSRESVHWIWPIIGAGMYMPGIFILFQCVLVYLPSSYPKYTASILAGNDFFRSTLAAGFPLFGAPFFHNLGMGPACSLLGGLSLAMIPILWFLMAKGPSLRSRSKYATVY